MTGGLGRAGVTGWLDAGWRQRCEQKINQGRVERPSVGEKSTKCMFGRESRMAQGCHAHTAVEAGAQRSANNANNSTTVPVMLHTPKAAACLAVPSR